MVDWVGAAALPGWADEGTGQRAGLLPEVVLQGAGAGLHAVQGPGSRLIIVWFFF